MNAMQEVKKMYLRSVEAEVRQSQLARTRTYTHDAMEAQLQTIHESSLQVTHTSIGSRKY